MAPSPTLPPNIAALAHQFGLGELADQAQAVLTANAHSAAGVHAQGSTLTEWQQVCEDLGQLSARLDQLIAALAPLVALADQLAPVLALPKLQRAIAKAQG